MSPELRVAPSGLRSAWLFTSPVLVMLRLGITGVPTWQLIASMAVLITSVVAGLWIAAKLLRIYLLMYGKRPRLREIVRALRAGKGSIDPLEAPGNTGTHEACAPPWNQIDDSVKPPRALTPKIRKSRI